MTGDAALPALAAAAVVAVFVHLAGLVWARLAQRHGWIDRPGERRLHARPTPRGGGIGIAVVLVMSLALAAAAVGPWLALGALIVTTAGLADDLRPLPPALKLVLQAIGVLPLALHWPLLPELLGSGPGTALAGLLALGMINAWNFMDGSNGLVTSQGLLLGTAAVGLSLPAPGIGGPGLPLLLAACCLGFLPLNFPRARLFLGDVGSHAIGFAAAVLLLSAQAGGGVVAALAWLPLSAILLDAGLTLAAGVLAGRAVWRPHRRHLYQRAVLAGRSHSAVAAAYALWTLLAALIALALLRSDIGPSQAWIVVVLVYALGAALHLGLGRRWPPETLAGEARA